MEKRNFMKTSAGTGLAFGGLVPLLAGAVELVQVSVTRIDEPMAA